MAESNHRDLKNRRFKARGNDLSCEVHLRQKYGFREFAVFAQIQSINSEEDKRSYKRQKTDEKPQNYIENDPKVNRVIA